MFFVVNNAHFKSVAAYGWLLAGCLNKQRSGLVPGSFFEWRVMP